MADEDEEHVPQEDVEEPRVLRKCNREILDPKSAPLAKRIPLQSIKEITTSQKKMSKQLMGHSVNESLSFQAVNAALHLQMECLQEKSHNGGKAKAPGIRNSICSLFGLSSHSYGKISKGNLVMKQHVALHCDRCLSAFFANRETKPCHEEFDAAMGWH